MADAFKLRPKGWVPRKDQFCANCGAFVPFAPPDGPGMGLCADGPATPILLGIEQVAPTPAEQQMAMLGKALPIRQRAITQSFWPQTDANKWCRHWGPVDEE